MLYQGLEAGETLVNTTLNVLESVGKNAVDVIVHEVLKVFSLTCPEWLVCTHIAQSQAPHDASGGCLVIG